MRNPFVDFAEAVESRLPPADEAPTSLHAGDDDIESVGGTYAAVSSSPTESAEADEYEQEITDDDFDDASGLYEAVGMEAVAFYKPFRNRLARPFPGKWGIFEYSWSRAFIARRLTESGATTGDVRSIARDLIRYHELFHFLVEVMTLEIEIVTRRRHYDPYSKNVYSKTFPGSECVEESLANAYGYSVVCNRLAPTVETQRVIERYLSDAPPAYAGWDRPSEELQALLASQLIAPDSWASGGAVTPESVLFSRVLFRCVPASRSSWLLLQLSREELPWFGHCREDNCPIYVVQGVRPGGHPAFVPTISEMNRFVAKYLRGERTLLESNDPHEKWRIDNGEIVKVPNTHGRQKEHERFYHEACKAAGLTSKAFKQERVKTNKWKRACPRPEPLQPLPTWQRSTIHA